MDKIPWVVYFKLAFALGYSLFIWNRQTLLRLVIVFCYRSLTFFWVFLCYIKLFQFRNTSMFVTLNSKWKERKRCGSKSNVAYSYVIFYTLHLFERIIFIDESSFLSVILYLCMFELVLKTSWIEWMWFLLKWLIKFGLEWICNLSIKEINFLL